MRAFILSLGALALAAGAALGQPAPSSAPVASGYETFARLPSAGHVALSPDGATLAYVSGTAAGAFIELRDVGSGRIMRRLSVGEHTIASLQWGDDDHLLLTQKAVTKDHDDRGRRGEFFLASELNVRTGAVNNLLNDDFEFTRGGRRGNFVYKAPMSVVDASGQRTIYLLGEAVARGRPVLAVFSSRGGKSALAAFGDETTVDFAVSPTGAVVGRIDFDFRSGRWTVNVGPDADHLRPATSGVDLSGHPLFAGASADGRTLYLRTNDLGDQHYLQADLATGTVGPAPAVFDGADLYVDPNTRIVVGVERAAAERTVLQFLDPAEEEFWTATARAFGAADVGFVGEARDHSVMVVKAFGGEWGYSYALVRRNPRTARFLFDAYAGIGPDELAPERVVRYKAADGLDLWGYLTAPRTTRGGPPALVVLPHAGLGGRDDAGFHWWAQALAKAGYAVFQPQFRGSTGWGGPLFHAGLGALGRKMQTDLSDGVGALAKQGLVDPRRVAVVGVSYGGYAALAGAALQPGVYRCAVSIAGPSNMRAHLSEMSNGDKVLARLPAMRLWRDYLGVTSNTSTELSDISPDLHAEAVEGPVLLIHGRDDPIVAYAQTERMQAALVKAGKQVELVTLAHEDHWLASGDTRLQAVAATVGFLKRCNPPD